MITREVDYAIRTVLALARRGAGSVAVATADLARETGVPFRFLRRIIRKLVEGGILTSQRGNGGGVQLTKASDAISLLAVIAAVDSRSTKLNLCTVSPANCPRSGICRVHSELLSLQTTLESRLDQISMVTLMQEAQHTHDAQDHPPPYRIETTNPAAGSPELQATPTSLTLSLNTDSALP